MMNTAQTNQTMTAYSAGVGFCDGGKNQNMIVQCLTTEINDRRQNQTASMGKAFGCVTIVESKPGVSVRHH